LFGVLDQLAGVLLLQPFSQKSRTATVPKVFQIGLCGVVEAVLELFWDSWSVGFLGERLNMGVAYVLRACQTAKPVRARVFAPTCLQ